MPKIRFLKSWAERPEGHEENNPDPVLCAKWAEMGVVEIVEEKKAAPKRSSKKASSKK